MKVFNEVKWRGMACMKIDAPNLDGHSEGAWGSHRWLALCILYLACARCIYGTMW